MQCQCYLFPTGSRKNSFINPLQHRNYFSPALNSTQQPLGSQFTVQGNMLITFRFQTSTFPKGKSEHKSCNNILPLLENILQDTLSQNIFQEILSRDILEDRHSQDILQDTLSQDILWDRFSWIHHLEYSLGYIHPGYSLGSTLLGYFPVYTYSPSQYFSKKISCLI